MVPSTLAHVSDLHLGGGLNHRRASALVDALLADDVDHVVVTGDITHRGRHREWEMFRKVFAPLLELGRLTLVPGNHDRLGDDMGDTIMGGSERVVIERRRGLHLVRFNSTGPHNRRWLHGHGLLTRDDLAAIVSALDQAEPGNLVALLLHHHVFPLPCDYVVERLTSWLGWPFCKELPLGPALLGAIRGRCDLVLHGHRHYPGTLTLFPEDLRPLSVFNSGSSTELGHVRVFQHAAGKLVGAPMWTGSPGRGTAPFREYIAPIAGWHADVQAG